MGRGPFYPPCWQRHQREEGDLAIHTWTVLTSVFFSSSPTHFLFKAEIRIQFKDPPAADYMFSGEVCKHLN